MADSTPIEPPEVPVSVLHTDNTLTELILIKLS